MIVLAIFVTLIASGLTVFVVLANGMRTSASPGSAFEGIIPIVISWASAAVVWLAWWVG